MCPVRHGCRKPPAGRMVGLPGLRYPHVQPGQYSKRITFQHTFPLPSVIGKGLKPTRGAGKKPRPAKPKSATKNPLTPKPKNPGPPKQERREYDRTRNRRPERMEYHRSHARERRKEAKALGLCKSCSNPAIHGQTRCENCAGKHRVSRRISDAKRSTTASLSVTATKDPGNKPDK